MKAEIKTKEKGFEPIEITITLHSREELLQMWARSALKHDRLQENLRDLDMDKEDVTENFFVVLNNLYSKHFL